MSFVDKLVAASRANHSLLCVGLDTDAALLPAGIGVFEFNRAIIEATSDLVCAYKPNFAFYEAQGLEGLRALERTLKCIPANIPTIADAKRADIGNTSRLYARAIYETWGFDACTVNPYLGFDAVEPFLHFKDKGVIILCRTSNPGAADFQSLRCEVAGTHQPLYEVVAEKAQAWNSAGNVGLVVGATYSEELRIIRTRYPEMPLLIPGVGTQGGDLATTVKYGMSPGGDKAIINSSRQVLYASRGKDFAEAGRQAALALRDEINRCRVGHRT
jgi:orotidine-5'-phosphate decarboxylase